MNKTYVVPYTEKEKEMLKKRSESIYAQRAPISEATGAVLLDCLGEIQNALQTLTEEVRKLEAIVLDAKNR